MRYEELRVSFGDLAVSGMWMAPLTALVAAFVLG
jgi:hypothetical protein